jgi:hypothetical protein
MAGTSRAKQKRKSNAAKARSFRHQNSSVPIPEPATLPVEPLAEPPTEHGTDDEMPSLVDMPEFDDCNDFGSVDGVSDIMTRFVELEESGVVQRWSPECDSEEGMAEDDALPDMKEAEMLSFANKLQQGLKKELEREKENQKYNNRSNGYLKNSKSTLFRRKRARDEYAKNGGKFISHFFLPSKKPCIDHSKETIVVSGLQTCINCLFNQC